MATSLRPSISICLHWIAWSRKSTPRIKQRVASCHTCSCPTPAQGNNTDLRGGWWDPHHVWYRHPSLAQIGIVLDFPISLVLYGMMSLKVSMLDQQIGENCMFFRPQILYGAPMNNPVGHKLFQNMTRRAAKFRENWPRDGCGRKRRAVLSNYKARRIYETWQLWLER